jgi:thiaminase (transcriptional activator TenA)
VSTIETMESRAGFTGALWKDAEPIFEAILAHPFLTGLVDATLPRDRFGFFIAQDGHYLKEYARALAYVAGHARDPAEGSVFLGTAARAVAAEQGMHAELLTECGITADEAAHTPLSPSGELYVQSVLAYAAQGPYEDGVAAVVPCLWIYREVGRVLVRRGSADRGYQRWIDSYGSDEYGDAVTAALDIVDRIGRDSREQERARFRRIFLEACRYEWMFWDAAWRLESWPIEIDPRGEHR